MDGVLFLVIVAAWVAACVMRPRLSPKPQWWNPLDWLDL